MNKTLPIAVLFVLVFAFGVLMFFVSSFTGFILKGNQGGLSPAEVAASNVVRETICGAPGPPGLIDQGGMNQDASLDRYYGIQPYWTTGSGESSPKSPFQVCFQNDIVLK